MRIWVRFVLMLCCCVLILCGCTQTVPESDYSPTARPERTPANNEKPDLIAADNVYADVAVYDKFGAWPQKSGDEYYASEVGTWFTLWWHEEGQEHYDRWYSEALPCRLKPVDYGYYSSGNHDYLTSVFVRMKYIGIDFLVLDDTNGYQEDITNRMYQCYKVAGQLEGYSPKIAIATGGAIRDRDDASGQQADFNRYYGLYKRYSQVFYQYEGNPLLIMYVAGRADLRFEDKQNRFTLRYGTGLISWQNLTEDQTLYKTQGNWGWVFNMQNEGTEIMGVQPGYNKPGMESAVIKRENGKHYIEQWLAAIKADPKVIMIPSYNDHAEETGWEATIPIRSAGTGLDQGTKDEDPYVYEKITEAYLALRYGYIEGFFYQTEGTSQIYQCINGYLEKVQDSQVGNEPIILLPEGYIEWELNRNRA